MKNRYKIIRDPKYGYLRANPVPTQEEVEKFYREEFYSVRYKRFNDSSLKVQKEEREFFENRYNRIYEVCARHFVKMKGRSFLDIGCGFAQALLYFRKKGLSVSGLEPSPEGVEYARSQGLEVFQNSIEDVGCVGKKRFDIVTLINVLEHLRQPAKTLISIKEKVLKTNGVLVLDVPNEFNDFQLIANKEYKLGEWWVCPPNHINYFSATSLSKFLKTCGYEIIECETSFPMELFLLMGDVYVKDGKLGKICHNKRVNFEQLIRKHGKSEKLNELYRALARLDLGRQIVTYATPKAKKG